MDVYTIGVGALVFGAIYVAYEIYQGRKNVAPYDPEPSQQELEKQLFERIMREGTDEQKLVALTLQQNKKLDTLKGLVLFDIFFG